MPDKDDEYFETLKTDPRFAAVKKLIRTTIDDVVAERKAAKNVPKKKVGAVPHVEDETDEDEDDEAENIFDRMFGPKK